ncbi:MAG TPA: transposase [Chloroflexia bacterium]|nr:transposase [Chloroflexia bacterium]
MSDNFKRYHCIKTGLRQLLPKALSGYEQRMLEHLYKLINGIIAASHCQLPKIAAKDPRAIKTESKIASLKRLLKKEQFTTQLFWLPFVQQFLASLATSRAELMLVMDGSQVGRGWMALVVNLVYAGRSLPISWLVVKGPKGHLSEDIHLQLLEQVQELVPQGVKVVFVGDGEFDGTRLQERMRFLGWQWVARTAKNSQYLSPRAKKWHSFQQWRLVPGRLVVRQKIGFSWEG